MKLPFVVLVGCALTVCARAFPAPLQVAITMSKEVYVAGEPVFVNVKMTNTSSSSLTVVVSPVDSCLSPVTVVVEDVPRADQPPCLDPILSAGCSYNGPGGQLFQILPGKSHEMRRFLGFIYDLQKTQAYRAHVSFHLPYEDRPLEDRVASVVPQNDQAAHAFKVLQDQADLSFKVIAGDDASLRAAFAPILADVDGSDFGRHWEAQLVLLNLAPQFAEDRILVLADRLDIGSEAMPALRKLGTSASLQKLERVAFEVPDGKMEREGLRQSALYQLRYVSDRSLLPALYEVMTQQRWQATYLAAASAAARIAHGEAVPAILATMNKGDTFIAFAGAQALGDTKSREAVDALLSAMSATTDANVFSVMTQSLQTLTHRRSSFKEADRANIQREWNAWWGLHHDDATIYGPDMCGPWEPLSR